MRILKLDIYGLSNMKARSYESKKDNKMYFNINHGLKVQNYKCYTMYLSYRDFKPKNKDDEIELKGSDYLILPINKNGSVLKNQHNESLYCIYKDNNKSHMNDILLFWEVPNKNYYDLKYDIKGSVDKLAEGTSGVVRRGESFITPMPILDIYGDCTLSWSWKDSNGVPFEQTLSYRYGLDNWDNC